MVKWVERYLDKSDLQKGCQCSLDQKWREEIHLLSVERESEITDECSTGFRTLYITFLHELAMKFIHNWCKLHMGPTNDFMVKVYSEGTSLGHAIFWRLEIIRYTFYLTQQICDKLFYILDGKWVKYEFNWTPSLNERRLNNPNIPKISSNISACMWLTWSRQSNPVIWLQRLHKGKVYC